MKTLLNLEEYLLYVGNKLYTSRHMKREKIKTVANNIGVSHPVISQIENGRYKHLSFQLLCKILDYYELPIDDFFVIPQNTD